MSRTDKDAPSRVRLARGEVPRVRLARGEVLEQTHTLDPPPRWFIRARFRGPERRRVNRAARLAAIDYNTNGGTDVELPVDQHRQGAKWLWW